jgi:Domain of unknown function (DUF4091)
VKIEAFKRVPAGSGPASSRSENALSYLPVRWSAMMKKLSLLSFVFLVLPALAVAQTDPLSTANMPAMDTNAADYPSNVWITGPLAKVLQNTGTPGTTHWALVYSTRNEIQSFQVHVQAPAAGIPNLSVTMSDLVNAKTATHISASSTDIVVYIERYMNVTIKTATGATFLNTTGYIPDILVPAVDPYYHQTTNAFPFNVAANQNQSVWIDVHVPSAAPSGYYSGTVTVKSGGTTLATMPVVYAVWDWAMPSTATLTTFTGGSYNGFCQQAYTYGTGAGCSAYPNSGGTNDGGATASQQDTMTLLLDHRYSDGGQTNSFPGSGSFSGFDSLYAPFFNGTTANVPGILQGAKLTSYSISLLGTLSANQGTFQNFQKHFAANGWITPFYYLCDEPQPGGGGTCGGPNVGNAFPTLIANGNAIQGYSTPEIPNLVTTDIVTAASNGGLNAIDWMVVPINVLEPVPSGPIQSLSSYQTWLAGNSLRQFWSYQACGDAGTCGNGTAGSSQFTYPNYNVDGTPVANRMMEWMTFFHGQTAELYYYIDSCATHACGYPTSTTNPIVSNYQFGGWGDGTLVYTGSSSYVGTKIPLVLPSMRLKMIRDGVQDYEYLHALTAAGEGSLVNLEVKSVLTNSYTFSNDPAVITAARQALGTALHQLAHPTTGLLPPANLTGTAH